MEGEPPNEPPPQSMPPKPTMQQFARMASTAFTDWLWASMFRSRSEPEARPDTKGDTSIPSAPPPSDDGDQRRVKDEQTKARNRRAFEHSEKMRETVQRQQYEKRHGLGYSRADGSWVSRRDDPPESLSAIPNWFRMGGKVWRRQGFGPAPDDEPERPPPQPTTGGGAVPAERDHVNAITVGLCIGGLGFAGVIAMIAVALTAPASTESPLFLGALVICGALVILGLITVGLAYAGMPLPAPGEHTYSIVRKGIRIAFWPVTLIALAFLAFSGAKLYAIKGAVAPATPAASAPTTVSVPTEQPGPTVRALQGYHNYPCLVGLAPGAHASDNTIEGNQADFNQLICVGEKGTFNRNKVKNNASVKR